ncbi:hypothetical protein C823_007554 [Eubacterium plexicaudatum ASF492]|nr:hypothetical protein C823_007554 [Eubacterium plexicaudatum ASF492]
MLCTQLLQAPDSLPCSLHVLFMLRLTSAFAKWTTISITPGCAAQSFSRYTILLSAPRSSCLILWLYSPFCELSCNFCYIWVPDTKLLQACDIPFFILPILFTAKIKQTFCKKNYYFRHIWVTSTELLQACDACLRTQYILFITQIEQSFCKFNIFLSHLDYQQNIFQTPDSTFRISPVLFVTQIEQASCKRKRYFRIIRVFICEYLQ